MVLTALLLAAGLGLTAYGLFVLLRLHAQEADQGLGAPQAAAKRRSRRWQCNDAQPAAWAALFVGALLMAWLRQRFESVTFVLALTGFLLFVRSTHWWPRHRVGTIAIGVNAVVIFTYLWSLGETEHIVINVTPGRYLAQVGSSTVAVTPSVHGAGLGLYSGTISDYRVLLAGEAKFDPNSSLLARFGAWVREASPRPAWTNVRVISERGAQDVLNTRHRHVVAGKWGFDGRDEYEGAPASSVLLTTVSAKNYTVEADLMRGDGLQGIFLGVDHAGNGYLFAPRVDQPAALWFTWKHGATIASVASTSIQLSLLAAIQRNVRLALANALVGLVLFLLSTPIYLVISLATRRAIDEADIDRLAGRVLGGRAMDIVALVFVFATTVVTGLVATQLLQGIPHVQDSVADLFQAQTLATGHLWVHVPKLSKFFTEEFIPMYHGKWFGKYPPGWPVLLTLGVWLHVPWLVNPILAGLDVGVIYLIGREVYSPLLGAIAAALALSSPFLLFLGGSFMAHTSTLFYLSASAYLLIRWLKRHKSEEMSERTSRLLLVAAGFLAGMGAITRQLDAAALAVPFTLALFPALWRTKFRPAIWLILGGFPPILAFLLYNWDLTGSPLTSAYTLWWPFDKVGFGPTIGMGGFTVAQGFTNLSINLQMLLAHLFGWPFYFTLALTAIPFLTGRASRWDLLFLASGATLILAYVAYWNPGIMYGPRYLYVTIPFFALLSARGLEELYRLPLRLAPLRNGDRLAALIFPVIVTCVLVAYDLDVYLPAQVPIYRGYNFTSRASLNAVENAHIHNALVFVVDNPPGQWWSYGEVFPANGPALDGDIVYAHDLGRADRQLARLYPTRATYRLNGTVLTRMTR